MVEKICLKIQKLAEKICTKFLKLVPRFGKWQKKIGVKFGKYVVFKKFKRISVKIGNKI